MTEIPDWSRQITLADVVVGAEIPAISMPITLQRLVQEAGSNRDLSLIHHNKEVAQSTGAADAYMNTFFIIGLFERMLREWMGAGGRLKKKGMSKSSRRAPHFQHFRFSGLVCIVA